ncbi:efflux RND transporter periplasmic adaptor subunit [Agromyces sp. NPDC058136]|uniref:efflux RND transporter periplasmic adaptor subunit n=1 Tax=Agromyces sp. NPDC058136 TaxID=3346354 RepID=UPI0036D7C631
MSKKTWMIISAVVVAVAIAGGAVFAFANPFAAQPTPPAATATVEKGTVSAAVSGKGAIGAATTSNASFAKGGTITAISVTVGQTVAAGQELATVDPADADRELEKVRGGLRAAETALANTREALQTAKNALGNSRALLAAAPGDAPDYASLVAAVREQEGALPSRDTDVVNAVKARDDAAREVEAAQAARDQTVLKAPMAGVVTAINGTVGSIASGGGTSSDSGSSSSSSGSGSSTPSGLITISDVSSLRVVASIPEADIARVALEQTAVVTLAGRDGVSINGLVTSVEPTPQTSTEGVVSYAVRIQLVDPPASVKLGQTGFVSITTAAASDVLMLPTAAVTLTAPGEGTVQLVRKKGAPAKVVPVKTGLSGGGFTEITEGLDVGDIVELTVTPSGGAGEAESEEVLG